MKRPYFKTEYFRYAWTLPKTQNDTGQLALTVRAAGASQQPQAAV